MSRGGLLWRLCSVHNIILTPHSAASCVLSASGAKDHHAEEGFGEDFKAVLERTTNRVLPSNAQQRYRALRTPFCSVPSVVAHRL